MVWKEDGIFFIDYDHFCKYFSDIQICYFHDGYKYSALKVHEPQIVDVYLKFTI